MHKDLKKTNKTNKAQRILTLNGRKKNEIKHGFLYLKPPLYQCLINKHTLILTVKLGLKEFRVQCQSIL